METNLFKEQIEHENGLAIEQAMRNYQGIELILTKFDCPLDYYFRTENIERIDFESIPEKLVNGWYSQKGTILLDANLGPDLNPSKEDTVSIKIELTFKARMQKSNPTLFNHKGYFEITDHVIVKEDKKIWI